MSSIEVINPYSQEVVNSYKQESFEEVQDKAQRAQESFQSWRQLSLEERIKHIKVALEYFETHKSQIAEDITQATGKPLKQSFGEIKGFFERAYSLCEFAQIALAADELPQKPGFERYIRHEPLGVILVVSAWNYPLLITVNSVVAGLLAGNTILLKHSSLTTAIGQHFANAFNELGEHRNCLQSVVISHDVTNQVIEQASINHVVFTGSVSGGHEIYQHVSKRFMGCNLELGGKDGAYVAPDADPVTAADSLVDGSFYNAGQSCCGIERVYVHESIYDTFVQRCVELANAYKLGDPLHEDTDMGPLAKPSAANYLSQQVQDAQTKGAKVLCGGEQSVFNGAIFFPPTIIVDVDHSMMVMTEENFGPILPIMKVASDEEGFAKVADSHYGLTAVIFTQDKARAEQFAKSVDAGTIFLNRCDYLDPELPWTGVKDSGRGSALSKYGFYELTRRKALHFKY